MSPFELKESIHKIIDEIDDNDALENFYEIISDYTKRGEYDDIIDELNSSQKKRLAKSMEQSYSAQLVMDKKAKSEINKWLKK
jgi:hypothetical protein